jgi:hypothetical protein
VFPSGIPIGTVTAVGEDTSPLVREVQVSPFVDFTRIHHVLVVRSAPVEDVPPLTDLQDLEFEPPDGPPIIDRSPSDEVPTSPAPDPDDDADDDTDDDTEGDDAEDEPTDEDTEEEALTLDTSLLAAARGQVEGQGHRARTGGRA